MLVLVLALVIQDPAAEVAAELTTHATPRPLSAEAVTEESPGFLGAHRRPFTDERPLLKKWPEQGPKLLWERRTGGGYAAPAIVKGRLILFHRLAGLQHGRSRPLLSSSQPGMAGCRQGRPAAHNSLAEDPGNHIKAGSQPRRPRPRLSRFAELRTSRPAGSKSSRRL